MSSVINKYFSKVEKEIDRVYKLFLKGDEYEKDGIEVLKGINIVGDCNKEKEEFLKSYLEKCNYTVVEYDDCEDIDEQFIYIDETIEGKVMFYFPQLDETFSERGLYELYELLNIDARFKNKIFLLSTSKRYIKSLIKEKRGQDFTYNIEFKADYDDYVLDLFKDMIGETPIKLKEELQPKFFLPVLNEIYFTTMKEAIGYIGTNYGYKDISECEVLDAINMASNFTRKNNGGNNKFIALDQAGKALVAVKEGYFNVISLICNDKFGFCRIDPSSHKDRKYEFSIHKIRLMLGGITATKMIYKTGYNGNEEDLQEIRREAEYLVNKIGYKGEWLILPDEDENESKVLKSKRRNNEKLVEKIIKKERKQVYNILKKYKDELLKLRDALCEKGNLNIKEIYEILN